MTNKIGHNSVSGDKLKSFVERIERMEVEKQARAEDIKEIYAEAKGAGFDAKIIRKIVKLKKSNAQQRKEEQELLEIYASAMQLDLNL